MIFTRTKQKEYRQRLPDKGLVALVYSICLGERMELLDDWLLDHPMHRHDLCILFWLARIEYDGRDNPKRVVDRRTKKEVRRDRKEAYHLIWYAFREGYLKGLANSTIKDTCCRLLGIDHLGRTVNY